MSLLISAGALLISLLNSRNNWTSQKAKELKEQFDDLNEHFKEQRQEDRETLDKLQEEYDRIAVLEERIDKEINISEKYRDKFETKLDAILKVIYRKSSARD